MTKIRFISEWYGKIPVMNFHMGKMKKNRFIAIATTAVVEAVQARPKLYLQCQHQSAALWFDRINAYNSDKQEFLAKLYQCFPDLSSFFKQWYQYTLANPYSSSQIEWWRHKNYSQLWWLSNPGGFLFFIEASCSKITAHLTSLARLLQWFYHW